MRIRRAIINLLCRIFLQDEPPVRGCDIPSNPSKDVPSLDDPRCWHDPQGCNPDKT